MTEIQTKLAELMAKDWTLANVARELNQAYVTVKSWNAGTRSPANLQSVLEALDRIAKRKPPKKKIYTDGNRKGASRG